MPEQTGGDKLGIIDRIGRALGQFDVPEPPWENPDLTTETSRSYYTEWLESFGIDPARASAYADYFVMDRESPIIASALDAIADAAVSSAEGESEDVYTISFPDEDDGSEEASCFFDCLEERTTVKSDTWNIIRSVCQLGDEFSEIVIDPNEMEITNLKPLPAESMIAVPDDLGEFRFEEYAYRQHNEHGAAIAEFEPWQIVHYAHRVRRTDLYGRSHLASTRRVFRQLQFIEDAMVINRLIRATMRYVHKIPTGGLSPPEQLSHVEKYKRSFVRTRRFDARSGKMLLGRNPLDEERDFFIAKGKDGQEGDVTAIQGQSSLDRIADVEYFLKKLFSALRTPPAYLGFESDTHAKSVITTLDVAFGRVVRRAQLVHSVGQRQIYQTELALKKIDPKKINFQFVYPSVWTVDEMRRWQIELLKAQVATMLKTQSHLIEDDEYILKKVLQVEEEDYQRILCANECAKAEQEAKAKEQADMMAASSPFGGGPPGGGGFGGPKPFGGGGGKPNPFAKNGASANVSASRTAEVEVDTKKKLKEVRAKSRHVSKALDDLFQRRNVKQELLELYKMAQPLVVNNGKRDTISESKIAALTSLS